MKLLIVIPIMIASFSASASLNVYVCDATVANVINDQVVTETIKSAKASAIVSAGSDQFVTTVGGSSIMSPTLTRDGLGKDESATYVMRDGTFSYQSHGLLFLFDNCIKVSK